MRLVVTVPWGAALGGAERMLEAFLAEMDRERVEVTAVFFEAGPFERQTAALGVATEVLPTGRLRQPRQLARSVRALAALLRREQPDLVLNWTAKAQLYGAAAALLAGMPERVVWWQHGVQDGHWMDRMATLLPAAAIGCSSAASADAQARLRPRRRTFVIHPGVTALSPSSNGSPVLAVPDGRLVIGIVGRLQPWKGQDRLLEAAALLRREGHDLHLLIVGGEAHGFSAGFQHTLAARVSELGMDDRVTMTGHVADVSPYLDAMHVMVNASHREPFGIVLLEAMARGVPVVAVDDAGPREIVESGRSGLLARSPAPEDLAATLAPLLRDPALRERLARGGRERVQSHFTVEGMTRRMLRRLEELSVRAVAPA